MQSQTRVNVNGYLLKLPMEFMMTSYVEALKLTHMSYVGFKAKHAGIADLAHYGVDAIAIHTILVEDDYVFREGVSKYKEYALGVSKPFTGLETTYSQIKNSIGLGPNIATLLSPFKKELQTLIVQVDAKMYSSILGSATAQELNYSDKITSKSLQQLKDLVSDLAKETRHNIKMLIDTVRALLQAINENNEIDDVSRELRKIKKSLDLTLSLVQLLHYVRSKSRRHAKLKKSIQLSDMLEEITKIYLESLRTLGRLVRKNKCRSKKELCRNLEELTVKMYHLITSIKG